MSIAIRHAEEVFRIVSWLWDDIEPTSTTDERFKRDFSQMLQAPTVADTQPFRLRLRRFIFAQQGYVEDRDLARFWFWNGYLLMLEKDNNGAFEAFSLCEFHLGDDEIAQMQLLTKFAYVKKSLMFNTLAFYDFKRLIALLAKHQDTPFSEGSLMAMKCNVMVQLASSYVSQGMLNEGLTALIPAIRMLNEWIESTHSQPAPQTARSKATSSTKSVFLSLTHLPQALIHSASSDVMAWLAVYVTTIWNYGWLLMWRCLRRPKNADAAAELGLFLRWLKVELSAHMQEVQQFGDFDRLPRGLKHLYRQTSGLSLFATEATFVLLSAGGIPLQEALRQSQEWLLLAETTNLFTASSHRSQTFRSSLTLYSLYREWWEIEKLAQDSDLKDNDPLSGELEEKLSQLIEHVRIMQPNENTALEGDWLHLLARYKTLLGQLYMEMGDQERAKDALTAAREIFASEGEEGHLLRYDEVCRLLHETSELDDDE